MARPYTINIMNGTGSANILSGDYTVTTSTTGYDNTSIDPASITIDKTTGTYSFEIAATGTLTIHVTEDGTSEGTPVVGATFVRCDTNENEYGSVITSDETGNAIFNNVPFSATDAPLIYYKQKSSTGEHEFDSTLKNTSLTESIRTIELENSVPLLRTINMTDTNYNGLPIDMGTITLS